jgi:bacteriorhodopsin
VRNWKPRDYAIAAMFAALGFFLSRVLPDWLWGGIAVAAFVASLWWSARQNRRRDQQGRDLPPEWAPDKPPSPS